MLQPKRTKFRKAFKGRIHGVAKGGFELNFGQFENTSRVRVVRRDIARIKTLASRKRAAAAAK